MDNEKNDRYYVERILKDLSFVIKHTEENLFDDFENNEILLDSVMFRFIQISENTKLLSNQFKNEHDNVPWMAIIKLETKSFINMVK